MKKTLRSSLKSISLIFLLTLFSCGKDDSSPPSPTFILDVEAYQYQMALLEFATGTLTELSYAGIINNQDVELTAISDSVLVFEVGSLAPGTYDLNIDQLGDTHIELTVIATVLEDTPAAMIEFLIDEMRSIDSDNPEIDNAISTLNDIFNNASADDQYLMAATFQANKALFEQLLYDEEGDNGRGSSLICATELCRFERAVYGIAIGGVLVYQANPLGLAIGLPVLIVSLQRAKRYHGEFLDAKIKVLDMSINEILEAGRINSTIQLVVDKPYIISIASNKRNVNSTDNTSDNGLIFGFFNIRTVLISTIESVNTAITFINENVPFADFELVAQPAVPATSINAEEGISSSNFNSHTFSIPASGITAEVSMHTAGKVKLTIKASNSVDLSNPIQTNLEINYNDDYNDHLSSFPVKIVSDETTPDGNFLKLPDGEYFEILNDYEYCYGGPDTEGDYDYEIGTDSGDDLYVAFTGFMNGKPGLGTYTIDDEKIFLSFDFNHPSLPHGEYDITSGSVVISAVEGDKTKFKFNGNASYWDDSSGSYASFGQIEGQITISCY